jgi:hypothetical protein
MRNAYKSLKKRPLGRPRHRCKDNNKLILGKHGEDEDWI